MMKTINNSGGPLLALVLALAIAVPASAEPQSWELTPYRVHLTITVAPDAALSPALATSLSADVADRLRSTFGGAWQLTLADPGAQPDGAAPAAAGSKAKGAAKGRSAEQPAAAADPTARLGVDKTLAARITRSRTGFRIDASEIDQLTGLFNAPVSRECAAAGELARETARALAAAFAPLAQIENVQSGSARLKLKGAALLPRETAQALAEQRAVFRPVLMKSDSRGVPATGSAQVVPWTYLVAEGVAPGSGPPRIACQFVTGLEGSPLPDFHPHRQRLALGVAASSGSTRLKIVTDDEQKAPQEGYEVVEVQTAADGQAAVTTRVDSSGADGVVVVPPGADALRTLVVRHGDVALARLPLVPGLMQEVTLPLPPAGRRVAIATALAGLEDDLIDRLARQEVLARQIEAATGGGDQAAADKLRSQLSALPSKDAFAARVAEQEQALAAADAAAQKLLAPRIASLKRLIEGIK